MLLTERHIRKIVRDAVGKLLREAMWKYAYELKWIKGKNYYMAKQMLLKRGYELNASQSYTYEEMGYMMVCFETESERVQVKAELHRNPNTGRLNGGDVIKASVEHRDFSSYRF